MKNIFISSTFRDMQAERDLVQEKVLPALREEARKYGDNVGVIDLRWGVDTSTLETDEGSAKVLKVCLDEIDRSHPYMLIFLGERYGWIPNGELIEQAVRERGDKYVTDDFEKSVTALEIEYGALSEQYGDLDRCIVCFREPISAEMDAENEVIYAEQNVKGKEKLEELKQRICKELGDANRLISYTCTWDESAQVLKDFTANGQPLEDVLTERYIEVFQQDWEAYRNLSWQEKEQLGFKSLMESKLRTFVGREALLEEYYEKIVSGTQPLILRGEVGSGKTAIMSKLIDRMQKEGKNVFPFFCGMGSMSKNAESLVQQMIYFVETQLGVEHRVAGMAEEELAEAKEMTEDELATLTSQRLNEQQEKKSEYDSCLEYLRELCFTLNEKVYIFIDALDQLSKDEHVERLDFLFGADKIQMIASCTDTFKLDSSVKIRIEHENIPMLSVEDAKQVAEGILRAESRDYFAELEGALLAKESIASPLYISLLIQRLNMMDQKELSPVNNAKEIVAYGAQVIAEMPDKQTEAAVAILKNAIKKISGQSDGLLLEVVCFLAVSRNGLNKEELMELFHRRGEDIPALDFTLLLKYLDGFFYTGEEDRVNFTHKVIRTGILEEIKNQALYENEVKEYLKTLDEKAGIYIQEGMYFARITEDYAFASQIVDDAYKNQNSLLVRAIIEDVVSDEATFFNKLLFETPTKTLRWCVEEKIIPNLDFSRKEMRTKIVLLKSVIGLKEMIYEQSPSDRVVRDLIVNYHDLGHSLKQVGEVNAAIDNYKKALEYAERVYKNKGGQDSLKGVMASCNNISHALKALGKLNEAIQYQRKVLEYAEELYEKDKTNENKLYLAVTYENIGHLLIETKRVYQAKEYFEKALNFKENLHEIRQTDESLEELSASYAHMAHLLRNLEQYELAKFYCEKSLKGYEYLYQKKKTEKCLWNLSISYSEMGHVLRAWGRLEEALAYYEQSKKCKDELHASQGSMASLREIVICYNNIGSVLSMLNMPEAALKYYEKCCEQAKVLYEELQTDASRRELAYSYDNMGDVLTSLKCYEEAINYYGEAMKCRQELHEKQKNEASLSELALSYGNMSQAMWKLRYYDYAINYLISQINCNKVLFEALHTRKSAINLLYSYENIVNALRALHRDEEVEVYEQNALQLREVLNKSKED